MEWEASELKEKLLQSAKCRSKAGTKCTLSSASSSIIHLSLPSKSPPGPAPPVLPFFFFFFFFICAPLLKKWQWIAASQYMLWIQQRSAEEGSGFGINLSLRKKPKEKKNPQRQLKATKQRTMFEFALAYSWVLLPLCLRSAPFVLRSIFKYQGFTGIDVFHFILLTRLNSKQHSRVKGEAVTPRHILWILFGCQSEANHEHGAGD